MAARPELLQGLWVAIGVMCLATTASSAEKYERERGIFVDEVVNPAANFSVRVSVDSPTRVYQFGDSLVATVRSSRKGFLYLFYTQSDGKTRLVFPNKLQRNNEIPALTPIVVPGEGASFRLRIGPPLGNELLKAVVTDRALDLAAAIQAAPENFLEFSAERCKGIFVQNVAMEDRTWAEHQVEITVVPTKVGARNVAQRRVAVIVALSEYAAVGIQPQPACKNDAKQMERVLERCEFTVLRVLINEQATKAAIEKAIRKELAEATGPGDLVVIYWSGHGGRISDVRSEEKDKYDEFLVTHDADTSDVKKFAASVVTDNEFGRWIQELDGRQIAVILDACHAGGQAEGTKSIPLPGVEWKLDLQGDGFLTDKFNRVKDIGQKDAMLLASSTPQEISYIRPDRTQLSVMTSFLIELLDQSPRKVTLADAYAHVKVKVPAYVCKHFDGAKQHPILAGSGADQFEIQRPGTPRS